MLILSLILFNFSVFATPTSQYPFTEDDYFVPDLRLPSTAWSNMDEDVSPEDGLSLGGFALRGINYDIATHDFERNMQFTAKAHYYYIIGYLEAGILEASEFYWNCSNGIFTESDMQMINEDGCRPDATLDFTDECGPEWCRDYIGHPILNWVNDFKVMGNFAILNALVTDVHNKNPFPNEQAFCMSVMFGSWACPSNIISATERQQVYPCFDAYALWLLSCPVYVVIGYEYVNQYEPAAYHTALTAEQSILAAAILSTSFDPVCHTYRYFTDTKPLLYTSGVAVAHYFLAL